MFIIVYIERGIPIPKCENILFETYESCVDYLISEQHCDRVMLNGCPAYTDGYYNYYIHELTEER